MSGGWTPAFASLATGSLCGRYPDILLWAFILTQLDKNGTLDVTHAYLALVTGLPVPEVVACMKRFCEPDPFSRTPAEQGARLVLLDQHRDWGWRAVNHAKYREKARLQARDAVRTESGRDAERKREGRQVGDDASGPGAERALQDDLPRCPPVSPGVPLSDTDSNTDPSRTESAREVPRGTSVERAYDQQLQAWREVEGIDHGAMEAWVQHCEQVLSPPKLLGGMQRISLAKLLAGMGSAKTQRDAVATASGNGWRNLRPKDRRDADRGDKFQDLQSQLDPGDQGLL